VLADFQQALADLTASPELCNAVRADPGVLPSRYALTARELGRLVGIAGHAGMASACIVYRMNRLAPLAMNVRSTMRALGPPLRALVSDYWRDHPRGHAHFLIESDRFCRWLEHRIAAGEPVSPEVGPLLAEEGAAVRAALAASLAEAPVLQPPQAAVSSHSS
jgi:hypothetical protein